MPFPDTVSNIPSKMNRLSANVMHRIRSQETNSGLRMRRRSARGLTLAAAIVSLMVIMLFASVVVRALGMRHKTSRWNERQLQSLFLVEAAVERAKVRLLAEPGFSGETWTVSLDDRDQTRAGVAKIRVQPVEGEIQQRRIEIEARWPDDPVHRVLRKKELIITLPAAGAAS